MFTAFTKIDPFYYIWFSVRREDTGGVVLCVWLSRVKHSDSFQIIRSGIAEQFLQNLLWVK